MSSFLPHAKVNFHFSLTYKIFDIGMVYIFDILIWVCEHFVYTENIALCASRIFFVVNYIEAGLVFRITKSGIKM